MKIDRHDQAKILSPDEIKSLFESGLKTARDRALFGVCLYTGARITEACSLHTKDVSTSSIARRILSAESG